MSISQYVFNITDWSHFQQLFGISFHLTIFKNPVALRRLLSPRLHTLDGVPRLYINKSMQDMQHHIVLLEAMEELNKVICERCDFRTNSKGLVKIHDQEQH